MKRIIAFIMLAVLALTLWGCNTVDLTDAQELSFKTAKKYTELKDMDDAKVYICGYMCKASPVDGSYLYLMNLPDQSCPFCLPNTTQLSNTMAVYPESGKSFDYIGSSTPIIVVGTLEVAESADDPFTDENMYQFSFRIVDASFRKMDDSEITPEMKLMKQIASSGIMSAMNDMFNYLDFVCNWPEYYVNSYTDKYGDLHIGYYLYASDALFYLQADGSDKYYVESTGKNYTGQYHYGYTDGYFESLIAQAEKLDMDGTDFLVNIIRNAQQVAQKAVSDLENGEYTSEYKYVEKFGTEDYIFTLTNGATYYAEYQQLYVDFEQSWLP